MCVKGFQPIKTSIAEILAEQELEKGPFWAPGGSLMANFRLSNGSDAVTAILDPILGYAFCVRMFVQGF